MASHFKQTKIAIILMLAFEALSLMAYFIPSLSLAIFIFATFSFLLLSLFRLKYGVYIALGEIFIGSKGYLLSLEIEGFSISIRIAFWLILLSVWIGNTLHRTIQKRKLKIDAIESKHFRAYILLGIFILWGLVNGILNKNEFSNIFFDFNAWLFFLYIFPLFAVAKSRGFKKTIISILSAGVIWLSIKTILLIYVFTHFSPDSILMLYKWVRDTGVGEITRMEGGFYRIFIQSQIFSLVLIFVWIWSYIVNKNKKAFFSRTTFLYVLLLSAASLNLLASYSRSYWAGLAVALICFVGLIFYRKIKLKVLAQSFSVLLLSAFLAFTIILVAVNFPLPNTSARFGASDLTKRASTIQGEAGVSSRWSLLPQLKKEIRSSFILGQGFGTTVTYKSSDPRVKLSTADGQYTTYAFEWGWLDIWLKLGFFGLLAYIYLLFYLIAQAIKEKNRILDPLIISLVGIAATSFFSPYINHPLGIAFVLIFTVLINNRYKQKI